MSNPSEELKNMIESYDIIHNRFVTLPDMTPDEVVERSEFKQMVRLKDLIDKGLTWLEFTADQGMERMEGKTE